MGARTEAAASDGKAATAGAAPVAVDGDPVAAGIAAAELEDLVGGTGGGGRRR